MLGRALEESFLADIAQAGDRDPETRRTEKFQESSNVRGAAHRDHADSLVVEVPASKCSQLPYGCRIADALNEDDTPYIDGFDVLVCRLGSGNPLDHLRAEPGHVIHPMQSARSR